MGRPKGSLNKKGKKPKPKPKPKQSLAEIKAEQAKEKQEKIKNLKSRIATDEGYRKLDEYDKRRDLDLRYQLADLGEKMILRKKLKKPPTKGKTNLTGRVPKGERDKLKDYHKDALKKGSIKYHSCARAGGCGKKYNSK